MNAQRNPETGKSPLHPAMASALLAAVASLIFIGGSTGSETALSLLPVLPVLVIFVAGAFAFTVLIRPVYALLSSAVSLAATVALALLFNIKTVGDLFFVASPVLVALVAGASMGVCMIKKTKLTSTLIISAAVPSFLIVSAVLIHSQIVTGSPTETLRVITEQVRGETVAFLNEYFLQMQESLGYELTQLNAESIVDETFNLLPGTLVATAAVLSFCVWKAMTLTARLFGTPSDIPQECRKLEISMAAAIIYVASLILSFVTKAGMVNASVQNITICLLPGLVYAGAGSYLAQRKNGIVKIGCLPLLIFIFLLYMNPAIAFEVLALFGAFDIIGRRMGKNKK